MINLSNVTLLAIDNTHRVENTIRALYTSINEIQFGKIKLITTKENIDKYYSDNPEIEFEEMIYNISDINTYSRYMIYELHNHVNTEFVINIQDHGFIINPSMWTDEFLEYDYIGAPWSWSENSYITPFGEHVRVGNGGVSMRSKKLLEVPLKVNIPFDCTTGNFYKHFNANNFAEDGNICVHNRHLFIEQGCKFAPVELAAKFSYESSVPENQGIIPFAFHYRLPPGIEIYD